MSLDELMQRETSLKAKLTHLRISPQYHDVCWDTAVRVNERGESWDDAINEAIDLGKYMKGQDMVIAARMGV